MLFPHTESSHYLLLFAYTLWNCFYICGKALQRHCKHIACSACIKLMYVVHLLYNSAVKCELLLCFHTVSCSCDIGIDNDDTIQSVCTGPSEAPCIMCGTDRCQVSSSNTYCLFHINYAIQ